MRRRAELCVPAVLASLAVLASAAAAAIESSPRIPQAAPNVAPPRPADWRVRPDASRADDPSIEFADMRPGWHITTRPAVVLFRPGLGASGDFTAETELFLFPKAAGAAGLVIGGADLEGASPRWIALLARGDGQFAVEERTKGATRAVTAWTTAASIVRPSEKGPGRNVLRLRAIGDQLVFEINDAQVATHSRSALPVDGLVGLRATGEANVHVTSLTVRLGGK
jgi:hypothetical protein